MYYIRYNEISLYQTVFYYIEISTKHINCTLISYFKANVPGKTGIKKALPGGELSREG